MKTLRIFFSHTWHDAASPCQWALCEENGSVVQSGSNPLSALPKGHHTVGILSARSVLCLQVKQPPGPRRRWLSALPYLVEEYCLRAPEDNFVVAGDTVADKINLYVLDKAWLSKLVESCQTIGLSLRKLYNEGFLANANQQNWGLVWDGNAGWINRGDQQIIPLDGIAEQAPIALQLLLQQYQPSLIEYYPVKTALDQAAHINWPNITAPIQQLKEWDWRRCPLPSNAPNLLSAEFAPRTKLSEMLSKFRPVLWMAAVLLGIQLIGINTHWFMLNQEKQSLNKAMEQSFYQAFGTESTLVNAPLQMQRNLATLRHQAGQTDPSDFLPLLNQIATPLSKLTNNNLQKIQYDSGRLNLELRFNQKSELEQFEQQLKQTRLNINVSEPNDTGNGIEARFSIGTGNTQ